MDELSDCDDQGWVFVCGEKAQGPRFFISPKKRCVHAEKRVAVGLQHTAYFSQTKNFSSSVKNPRKSILTICVRGGKIISVKILLHEAIKVLFSFAGEYRAGSYFMFQKQRLVF
ncbi:hypothetical protein GWC95_17780 [Sediminibacterium roseum]|uniref:Uncharacterized protein n=1 Tax=Sediminibacterium roseum TaxID=1978412 RepID=A0ABW9ZZ00_9BACT|nr:hypothetical protein [Sediminibacterium roseum]NCI51780.1 hypothetical protein [Sediminibacterium roseum]